MHVNIWYLDICIFCKVIICLSTYAALTYIRRKNKRNYKLKHIWLKGYWLDDCNIKASISTITAKEISCTLLYSWLTECMIYSFNMVHI